MSAAYQQTQKQTPLQEMAKRAAEAVPGLAAMGALVATANQEQLLADARARTKDGHIYGMQQLGMKRDDMAHGTDPQSEGDAMPRYTVCGDVYGDEAARQIFGEQQMPEPLGKQQNTPPAPSTPTKEGGSLLDRLAPWLLAAAGIPGAGLAGYWLSPDHEAGPAPPAIVDTDTDTYTQIEAVQIYQPPDE